MRRESTNNDYLMTIFDIFFIMLKIVIKFCGAGRMRRESTNINSSLMVLVRCLEALRHNQQNRGGAPKLVPYRESKITYLFRDVLHGWGQVRLQGSCRCPPPPNPSGQRRLGHAPDAEHRWCVNVCANAWQAVLYTEGCCGTRRVR
jgi:Kinesin motor domain